MSKDDEFLEMLRATFKVEAEEHVQAIARGLLELEKAPGQEARAPIVEAVFRAAHSLKGAARAVDHAAIEALCQSLEDVFASWKRGDSVPSAAALDGLHRMLDELVALLAAPAVASHLAGPVARAAPPAAPLDAPAAARADLGETVRVPVPKLEAVLLMAEEMHAVKSRAGQRAVDLRELGDRFEGWRKAWSVLESEARRARQSPEAPEPRLARLLDFLDWTGDYLKSVESAAGSLARSAVRDGDAAAKLVDDLLEESKRLLLLPFATVAAALARLVRDLCRDEGKEADFTIRGEDVEIDKRILEEIKDPLVHLLRNSIDHGIEPPAERARRGKPPRAAITLTVSRLDGNKVEIVLGDDGAGIDTGQVKASAIRRGVVSAQEAARLDESEAQALIFRSDVSTSRIVTQLSGRGLGLAIVRERVGKLGGEVSVESRGGAGTRFRIVLPATRATFRGVLVQAAGRLVVVPTAQVERVSRVARDEVRTVEGRDTVAIAGRVVALVRLADVLELPSAQGGGAPAGAEPLIVLGDGDQRVAFIVDAVLEEQEVLVRPLAKPLSRVRNVSAATVLGTGQVAPILNVADLLKSARRVAGARVHAGPRDEPAHSGAILVAEDSITSRLLIRNILESAGYRVTTAVDGMEAFTLLRAEEFDLVVSDVEMPRLDGFGLTARIRADRKLAELPVVLVTALESREDRERGIDAGADAYLVKSSFDQGNLLEAVRRLI